MSGRLHLFFTPDNDVKLKELVTAFKVDDHPMGESHICQVATEVLLEKFKYDSFTTEERTQLANVPEPVNHGRRYAFFKQTNVNRLFDLIKKFEIEHNDFALQHVVQTAVNWLFQGWKSGGLKPELLARLEKIEAPKVVYHN